MKNQKVIEEFVLSRSANCGSNLYVNADRLVNYSTCIGQWINGRLVINTTKYSVTTSRLQNYLLSAAVKHKLYYVTVEDVPMRVTDLTKFNND